MLIKRGGVRRNCTKQQYQNKYKGQGYEIIPIPKPKSKKEIDVEQYYVGYGWYEYQGNKYRKDNLIEKLKG